MNGQAFTDEALKKVINLEFLEKTGLTIVKGTETNLIVLKEGLCFLFTSMSGRILGFGGRILLKIKKRLNI